MKDVLDIIYPHMHERIYPYVDTGDLEGFTQVILDTFEASNMCKDNHAIKTVREIFEACAKCEKEARKNFVSA